MLSAGSLSAATSWDHVPVWPKSQRVVILDDPDSRQVVATATDIEWPAIVEKTDGQWLKISDPGAYNAGPVDGWLRKDDILRLENVQSFCTSKIRHGGGRDGGDPQSPSLADAYWIRGMFWENQGGTESALADYNQAIANGLRTGDVYLRLGRMQTQCAGKFADNNAQGNSYICECADKSFNQAGKAFGEPDRLAPAQYYIARGDAESARFLADGNIDHAKQALGYYRDAERSNSSWSLPPYKQGKLRLVALEQAAKKDPKQQPDKRTLLLVIQDLTQAIRLNPNCTEAYEDRADALRLLATAAAETPASMASLEENGESQDRPMALHLPVDPPAGSILSILEQANASADRAFLLSNNRGARALEVKARIEFAIAQELYKPHNPALELDKVARLDRAYNLFLDAINLAKSAADHSSTFSDIVGRFGLALDYYDKTNMVADDLSNRGATKVAANSTKLKSQLEIAKNDLSLQKETLEKLKSDDPQRALLLANIDAAEKQVDEASLALEKSSKQVGDLELSKLAHGKISAAADALARAGSTSSRQGEAIRQTVEVPSVARPPRPSYTPLNLDAK